jgi:hypothetical protein
MPPKLTIPPGNPVTRPTIHTTFLKKMALAGPDGHPAHVTSSATGRPSRLSSMHGYEAITTGRKKKHNPTARYSPEA